jgi:hypothetical protein
MVAMWLRGKNRKSCVPVAAPATPLPARDGCSTSGGRFLPQTYPAAQKNVDKLRILKEGAGTSNPKVFVAGEILRRLDEPLTETPTTR